MSIDNARRFVITLDDGYENVFKHAANFLRERKFVAIQFLVADLLGRTNEWDSGQQFATEPLMGRTQVMQWLSIGHEIGAHSLTHPRLSQLPLSRAREETDSSKKKTSLVFNPEVAAILKEASFCRACTTDPGHVQAGDDPFQLRRLTARKQTISKLGDCANSEKLAAVSMPR